MEIGETSHGDVVVLAPDGSLGSAPECTMLEQRLSVLLEKRTPAIVVDLARVRRISGAALRVLLVVRRRLTSVGGALVLCRLSEKVLQVFAIAGFDKDFTIVGSPDEALQAVKTKAAAAAAELGTLPVGEAEGRPATVAKDGAKKKAPADGLARLADRIVLALAGADGPTLQPFVDRGKDAAPALVALAKRTRKALGCA